MFYPIKKGKCMQYTLCVLSEKHSAEEKVILVLFELNIKFWGILHRLSQPTVGKCSTLKLKDKIKDVIDCWELWKKGKKKT